MKPSTPTEARAEMEPAAADREGGDAGGDRRAASLGAFALRHRVALVVMIALAPRVAFATYVAVAHGGSLFLDDATYADMAREMALGDTADWSYYRRWLYSYTATFLVPLTAVYKLFGTAPLPGQLLVAVVGAGTAALVCVLISRGLRSAYAVAGGLVVALLPSQVLWSSLTLKDAFVWAAAAALAVLVSLLESARRWKLGAVLGGCGVLLLCLESLRPHTLVIAAYALMLIGWFLPGSHRVQRGATLTVLALMVPFVTGHGLAGRDLVFGQSATEQRVATSQIDGETTLSESEAAKPDLEYLPRGLSIMLLEPLPWQDTGGSRLELAKVEQLLWYPLLGLALVGLVRLRQLAYMLVFPLVFGVGTLAVYALVEANLGTAFRHRGELVWPVATLASAGLSVVRQRIGPPGSIGVKA